MAVQQSKAFRPSFFIAIFSATVYNFAGKMRAHTSSHEKASTTENLHLSSSLRNIQRKPSSNISSKSCFDGSVHTIAPKPSRTHTFSHPHANALALSIVCILRRLMPIWRYQFHRFHFICMRKANIAHFFTPWPAKRNGKTLERIFT